MKLFIILFVLLGSSLQASTGLEIVAAGDIVYSQGLNQGSGANEKMALRGAEIGFFAPIDHRFDGFLSLAAHDEGGSVNFEVHELYFSSHKLIEGWRFKVGQFFLGLGRLNRFHQHDWPFTNAPKVHRDFLSSEAVFDSGIEVGTLLPTPFFLDLTFGITSGHRWGHVHGAGVKPKTPTHYLRLATFFDFGAGSGLEWGVSYVGRTTSQNERMSLIGMDLTAKWREGRVVRWLLSGEAWHRTLSFSSAETQDEFGVYALVEHGLSRQWGVGLRLDGYKNLTMRNILGRKMNNIHYGATAQTSFTNSEFFKTRLSLSHEFSRVEGATLEQDTRAMMQFIFIIGAHPAHEF